MLCVHLQVHSHSLKAPQVTLELGAGGSWLGATDSGLGATDSGLGATDSGLGSTDSGLGSTATEPLVLAEGPEEEPTTTN